jgi:hypothetical protein
LIIQQITQIQAGVLQGQWRNGFIGNLFGIFEATTNHAYKQVLARIATNNAAVERGAPSEFGRMITVHEIKSEVALHYLFNFNQRRFRDEVEHGVATARARCDKNLK